MASACLVDAKAHALGHIWAHGALRQRSPFSAQGSTDASDFCVHMSSTPGAQAGSGRASLCDPGEARAPVPPEVGRRLVLCRGVCAPRRQRERAAEHLHGGGEAEARRVRQRRARIAGRAWRTVWVRPCAALRAWAFARGPRAQGVVLDAHALVGRPDAHKAPLLVPERVQEQGRCACRFVVTLGASCPKWSELARCRGRPGGMPAYSFIRAATARGCALRRNRTCQARPFRRGHCASSPHPSLILLDRGHSAGPVPAGLPSKCR